MSFFNRIDRRGELGQITGKNYTSSVDLKSSTTNRDRSGRASEEVIDQEENPDA